MERVAALDQGVPDDSRASLIDLVGDTLYYYDTLEQGFGFYAKNINDNSVRELFRETDGSVKLEECRLWNGVIYYETTYQTADPAFYALNVESGESTRLEFDFPYEQYGGLYYTSFCEFYEDFAYVEARFYDEPGVHFYRLDYDTLSATPLASQENAVLDPIHRDGSKIYWESSYFYLKTYGEVEDAYGKVTEYDLETDTITEREEVVYSDQVLANSRGYYYKDTRDAFSGLYYYDYATGTAKQIDNTAVSSEVVPSPSPDKVLHPLEE